MLQKPKLVEMHSHVIYGVDDGAQTQNDMFDMLQLAADNGVHHLICTSHITPGIKEFPAQIYMQHFQEAMQWCAENAPQLKLHIGAEIMYTDATVRLLDEGIVPSLDQTMAVLVEFYPDEKEARIHRALMELGARGYTSVVAHVQRYDALKHIEQFQELKEEYNALLQMNSHTVFNGKISFFRRKRVCQVLDAGLIDFVSSDAHNVTSRPCCIATAHRYLSERYDSEYADELCGGNIVRVLGL